MLFRSEDLIKMEVDKLKKELEKDGRQLTDDEVLAKLKYIKGGAYNPNGKFSKKMNRVLYAINNIPLKVKIKGKLYKLENEEKFSIIQFLE